METVLITLEDKEIWDSYYVFEDRNKIQNKPKDLAQSYKVNINQPKYDILHLDLNISICLKYVFGNEQFLVCEFHEDIDSVLFILKPLQATTQHSAWPIVVQHRAWTGSEGQKTSPYKEKEGQTWGYLLYSRPCPRGTLIS